jgi:hypothetical protein
VTRDAVGARGAARERLLAAARSVRGPAVLIVVYLMVRALFLAVGGDGGLLTPSGSVSLGVAFLGLLVLTSRVLVLFVLVPVITYRILLRLVEPRGDAPR